MYCKCGHKIPEPRVKMGYKTCVMCSTEDKWGCAQVVYHKTGNTIEVIKDKELCEEINAMAQRKTFGVSNGMTGVYRKKPTPKSYIKVMKEKAPKLDYRQVGERTMYINEIEGIESAKQFLNECLNKSYISNYQFNKISTILKHINL